MQPPSLVDADLKTAIDEAWDAFDGVDDDSRAAHEVAAENAERAVED